MTDPVENIYLNALESLDFYDAKIKEAFGKLVRPDGRLDNGNIEDLLTDVSAIFGADMSEAKAYFSEANESIAKYFDLDMISYQDFKEIFKMWLQNKTTKKQKPNPNTSVHSNSLSNIEEKPNTNRGNVGKKVRISVEPKTPISSIGVLDSQRGENPERNFSIVTGLRSQDLENLPPNYESNKDKLDELLSKHSDEFFKKFEERKNGEGDTINIQDYFIFLQECFYMDEYLVMEKETDEKDFFGSVNSYKRLLKITQRYFVKVKGVDPSEFNPIEQQLTFDDCFDILNYWFKTDDNVLITNEKPQPREKSQPSDSNSHDVRKVLLETISRYTQMIEEATNEVEKQVLQTTIETLYKKLNELETGEITTAEGLTRKESQMQKFKRREDKRLKALRETFDFYSKQQLHGGKPISFENYERQFNTINLGKFSVILKNFRIKIDQLKLKELFKKIASNHEDVNFEEFYRLLEKVAKSAELIKEIKIVKPNPEIRKEYKPDSYKTNPTHKSTTRSESRKKEEKPKTEYEKIDELWDHMGLYDGTFRNSLVSVQLAFNSPEKETFRINPEILNSKPKYKQGEVNSTLDLKDRNELRKEVRDVKAKEMSLLHNYRAPASKSAAPKYEPPPKKEDSYASLKLGKPSRALPEKKMTLKQVGKFSYNEIGGIGAFNPYDLIEENDEEDNIYLAEYNLKPERKLKREKTQEDLLPEKNKKLSPGKRNPAPSRNSRNSGIFEYQNKLGGANSNSALNLHAGPKLTVIDDFDYRKIAESTPNPNMPRLSNGPGGLYVSQSAKHIGLVSNPKHLYYNPQYDGNQKYNITPTPQSYPIDIPPTYKKTGGSYVLDRANKVQQDSMKRGHELMNNIMNIQNTKLEQGLRVARK